MTLRRVGGAIRSRLGRLAQARLQPGRTTSRLIAVCQNSSSVRRPEYRTLFEATRVPRFLRGERASVSPASVARRTSLAYGCVHARRWKRQVANPRRTHRRHIGLVQETVACPLSRSHQSDGALRRSSGRANGDGNCFGSTTPAADNPTALSASDEPSGWRNSWP